MKRRIHTKNKKIAPSSQQARRTVRVGIDFGETIGTFQHGAAPHSFSMIRHLVQKFGTENMFVISKAGPDIELGVRGWLQTNDFYNQTGFSEKNVIFVRQYEEKAIWVQRLDIFRFLR